MAQSMKALGDPLSHVVLNPSQQNHTGHPRPHLALI